MLRTFGYAVLAAMNLLVIAQAGCEEERAMTEEAILSKLVVGMEQADVEEFFADHGIEYSLIPSDGLGREGGLSRDPSQLSGRYRAIIRNVKQTKFAFESISISVETDHAGRVAYVDVRRVTTGV